MVDLHDAQTNRVYYRSGTYKNSASRIVKDGLGFTALGGMLAATLFGILLIPGLYVMFQWIGDRVGALLGNRADAAPAAEDASRSEP